MYTYRVVEILRVVDGDTIDARASLGFGITAAFRFRLAGVDTPEMFGRYAVPEGKEAQDFTADWLNSHPLLVRTYKSSQATVGIGDGAFGRWLADFIDADTGESLAAALIGAGYGK